MSIKKFKDHKVNEYNDVKRIDRDKISPDNYDRDRFERTHKDSKIQTVLDKYNSILESNPIHIDRESNRKNHPSNLEIVKEIISAQPSYNEGIIDGVSFKLGGQAIRDEQIRATTDSFDSYLFRDTKIDSDSFHLILDIVSDLLNAIDIDGSKIENVLRNVAKNISVIEEDIYKMEEGKYSKFFKHEKINESMDIENSDPIQSQFNNGKYIKGYKSYSTMYGNSTAITDRFKLGDRVEVDLNEESHGGKFGRIIPGFSKDNPDMLKIEFEDGSKSALVEKTFLQRVANEF